MDPKLPGFASFLVLPVREAFECNNKMIESPDSHLVMILLLLLLLMTRLSVDFACQRPRALLQYTTLIEPS